MAIFKGAGVAIVTPMHADGSVNFEKLEETIDYQIENGTDSIVICGTTGESSTLSEEEHIECIRTAISRTAGRIPVIAGTGSNSTETAIYLTKEAEEAGADGALVVTPYYNKATQKGLVAHYTEIAKHTDMPIILYNVQSRTGVNIAPETAVTLAKTCDNIVGIKEASGNTHKGSFVRHESSQNNPNTRYPIFVGISPFPVTFAAAESTATAIIES